MSQTTTDRDTIRRLNDEFRRTGAGGLVMMTPGIQALSDADRAIVVGKVRLFDAFDEANDPHGEHDFGRIVHDDTPIFWKIDYYDRKLEFGSENPADPAQTTRVLTLMRAQEY